MTYFPRHFEDMDFSQRPIRITREQVVAGLLICFALSMAVLAGWDMGRPQVKVYRDANGQWVQK